MSTAKEILGCLYKDVSAEDVCNLFNSFPEISPTEDGEIGYANKSFANVYYTLYENGRDPIQYHADNENEYKWYSVNVNDVFKFQRTSCTDSIAVAVRNEETDTFDVAVKSGHEHRCNFNKILEDELGYSMEKEAVSINDYAIVIDESKYNSASFENVEPNSTQVDPNQNWNDVTEDDFV